MTVTVEIEGVGGSTVVVTPEIPVADEPPIVTVVVTGCWEARLLAWFSAFLMADSGIGVPATSHTNWRGVNRMSLSRLLSQLPCMQVTKSGRKFPADALQRHLTSVIEQLSSWD